MYFVVKNNIDKNGSYLSGEIVSHSVDDNKILENTAIAFAKDSIFAKDYTFAKEENNIEIIDVHTLDQVAEPLIDTILLYRVINVPNQIHVYERTSKQVPGYIYGQAVVSEFIKIKIFELTKYISYLKTDSPLNQIESEKSNSENEIIPLIGETAIDVAQLEITEIVTDVSQTEIVQIEKEITRLETEIAEIKSLQEVEIAEIKSLQEVEIQQAAKIISESTHLEPLKIPLIRIPPQVTENVTQSTLIAAGDLLASLESSPQFLKMKEKNN